MNKTKQMIITINKLRKALKKNEFFVVYQPKVDVKSGELVGTEALLRWEFHGTELIPPNIFIPAAEKSRLIIPIGKWVLHTVCKQIAEWQRKGLEPKRTAINISAIQLQEKGFLEMVKEELNAAKLDPKLLELEITESSVINDFTNINNTLMELREMGIFISLDDFGTGYSALSYIKNLNFDTLKIDRVFIQDMLVEKKNAYIVKCIISMAHALNIKVVAEGVERMDQLIFLKYSDCDHFQGYLYSKPVPHEEYEVLLSKRLNLENGDMAGMG